MLVLTRRIGEEVRITVGDREVVVSVVEIRGKQVRLGFKSDPDVRFERIGMKRRPERERREEPCP